MINLKEINEEIKKLENSDCTTYSICDKLAKLYIVRDHFQNGNSNNITKMESPMMNNMMPSK